MSLARSILPAHDARAVPPERAQPGFIRHAAAMDTFTLYRQWWADVSSRRPPKTARDYRGVVFRAFADTGWHPLEVGPAPIKEYLEGFRTAHANLIRHGLADFFSWLVEHGRRADDPMSSTHRRRNPRRRIKRAWTIDEMQRVLVAMRWMGRFRNRWEGTERLCWLLLGQYYIGARPGEITRMTTAHVHLDVPRPYVEIIEGKGGQDRFVPLSPRAVEVFTELCRDRVGRLSDVRGSQYWQRIKQACFYAGLAEEKARPYAVRHSFATHLIEAGVPHRFVAELMGHVDLKSLWGYTVPDDEVLRAAVELLP